MGTYTQIASLGRFSVAQQRRRGPRLDGVARPDREEAAAPFFCPSCGDGAVVATECGRCEVPMHPAAGALVVMSSGGSGIRAWLRRRSARRRASRAAPLGTAALPASTEVPVRVRGRLRVRDGRVVVEDEAGRARVRLGPEVRVYDDAGERSVLADGEDVEVVGVGARALGAGHGYRDARGDFELDGTRPLEVWVR